MLLWVERNQDLRERGCGHCGILALVTDTGGDGGSGVASFVLYTTTTCGPCIRLKQRLDEMGSSYGEVNVEDDAEASRWVMSVNQGDRVVPTLLFRDGSWLTNPSAQQVADHLALLT